VAGQTLPVTLEGVPVVSDNRVALSVKSTQVGSLPGPISDQLTQQLRQPLELGQPITASASSTWRDRRSADRHGVRAVAARRSVGERRSGIDWTPGWTPSGVSGRREDALRR